MGSEMDWRSHVLCFAREKKEKDAAAVLATCLTSSAQRRRRGSQNRACRHGDSAEVWVNVDANSNTYCN